MLRAASDRYTLAGRDWPEGRFTPEIVQVLINTREAVYLYFAGKDWPDGRFRPEIAQALVEAATLSGSTSPGSTGEMGATLRRSRRRSPRRRTQNSSITPARIGRTLASTLQLHKR